MTAAATRAKLEPFVPAYVETSWELGARRVTIGGNVTGGVITTFAAEDEDGRPVRVPEELLSDAHEHLLATASEIARTP